MGETTASAQLVKYLSDAHAIEEQALVQLRRAKEIAGDSGLAEAFGRHLRETEGHERDLRAALEARGSSPAIVKEAAMRAGGFAFALFARLQPDTPGKLAAHSYSYEHLELAAYALLRQVALRASDGDAVELAERIGAEERAMGEAIAAGFDGSVVASLGGQDAKHARAQLPSYLADAHALEAQSIALLRRGGKIAGDAALTTLLREHLTESRGHEALVEQRLSAMDARPSLVKDAAMKLGAMNWGLFFQAHPDTPGKLAGFAFAFEHLEIAGYEQLRRVAKQAGDEETVAVAERILEQERAAASKIAGQFEAAADASLRAVGVDLQSAAA